jgi:predicted ArsR family transcriptional regulator
MPTNHILQYLQKHGEQLDYQIADVIGAPLATTRHHLIELTTSGKIISCHLTRFTEGEKTEGLVCRLAGHVESSSPSRKSK